MPSAADFSQAIASIELETEAAYQQRANHSVYLQGIFRLLAIVIRAWLTSQLTQKKK